MSAVTMCPAAKTRKAGSLENCILLVALLLLERSASNKKSQIVKSGLF
jgi:hypothetical protein